MEKELVRSVARAFYDTEHVVTIDALVNHSALTIDDLKAVFTNSGRQNKDILKFIGRLREGGLVSCYGRQETKANAQKATTVEYFYIDYRRAIDATKYRLHMLQEKLSHFSKPTTEKKEFSCPNCRAQWTLMEVLEERDPAGRGSGFLCKRCATVLKYTPHNQEEDKDGDNPLSVFNKQFEWLVKLLGQIDKTVVPVVTGESAIENARPVPKEKAHLQSTISTATETPRARPTAVVGIRSGPEKVEITLTTDSENNAAVEQAEAERRARIANQNQLPSWHTQSTVVKETAAIQLKSASDKADDTIVPSPMDATDEKAPEEDDELVDFFQQMAEHQAAALQQQQDEEEDEESEDEDADEFENIEVAAPEAKRAKADDGSTKASDSAINTPARSGTPAGNSTPAGNGEESDEDDEEFETVV